MLSRSFVTGPKHREVDASLFETQWAVWSTTNPVGILIVLPVVLPETNGTDLVTTSFVERDAATTRALETESGLRRMDERIGREFAAVVFKPLLSRVPLRG